ncbi:MAG: response regulator transcription factor [Bacteroidales bacterium]|nr:response regulator transcription factor [Bacteroidales bacterium]
MKNPELSILLVEDDRNLGVVLATYLRNKGFNVLLSGNGQEALEVYRKEEHNFIITDVMMPIMDGFTFAKKIRIINPDVPIIFLTAKTMEEDRIKGFKIGADDYIVKPFSMDELLMRIHVIARRSVKPKDEELHYKFSFENIDFDFFKKTLSDGNETHSLSVRDTDLLKIFFQKENEVVDRSYVLNKIWGEDNRPNSRSLDVYITKFRSYLKSCPKVQIINIRNEGIKFIIDRSTDNE